MSDVDLLIVGAGPQALTLATYLRERAPVLCARTVVADPDDWLTAWDRQFAALRIPMLRSSCVHHPHPEPYALLRFAREHGRSGELHDDIGRPSTALFREFCGTLIDRLGVGRVAQSVRRLTPVDGAVDVELADRTVVRAARVVVASNPTRPVLPSWAGDALSRHPGMRGLTHSDAVSLGPGTHAPAEGEKVVVVGGGLTAWHLVTGAVEAGAHVGWLHRRPLRERDLDVEADWLGPRLREYHDDLHPARRRATAQAARGGGSMPERERARAEEAVRAGAVRVVTPARVWCVSARGRGWWLDVDVAGRREHLAADRVWCATGHRAHARHDPVLRGVRRARPVRLHGGLPDLAHDLSWPGSRVHVMGPLSVLGVGPACRTVIGARMAAERIVAAIAPSTWTWRAQDPWPD